MLPQTVLVMTAALASTVAAQGNVTAGGPAAATTEASRCELCAKASVRTCEGACADLSRFGPSNCL